MNKLIEMIETQNDYNTGRMQVRAHYECDSVADLPSQSQTDFDLMISSTAHVIDSNEDYEMQSSGVWSLQRSAGYYTRSEVDSLIDSVIPDVFGNNSEYQLSDGDDLNTIIQPGNYTAGSTSIAGAVLNSPWTATRYKFLNLVITGTQPTNCRAVQFIFPNLYTAMSGYPGNVFFFRYRHNQTFTPWAKVEGTTVT